MFGPIAAFESFIFNAFNFSGRATRAEYWWVFALRYTLFFVALLADVMITTASGLISLSPLAYFTTWAVLLTIVPATSLLMRRLHDSGKSGGWVNVMFVPTVGLFWLAALCMAKSEPEENRWGAQRRPDGAAPHKKAVKGDKPHDPMQGYATLLRVQRDPTPDEIAAKREEITEYYRTKVLGTRPMAG